MKFSDESPETAARQAYERGRLRFALEGAASLIPVAVLLPAVGAVPSIALASGVLLLVAAAGLLYRGGAVSRALLPGLAAGGIAWILPSLPRLVYGVCPAQLCLALCVGGAVTGGLLAGLVIADRARVVAEDRAAFLWSAVLVAFLVGISGCAVAGAAGVAGLVGGFLAGTTPLLLLDRPR